MTMFNASHGGQFQAGGSEHRMGDGWHPFILGFDMPQELSGERANPDQIAEIAALEARLNVEFNPNGWTLARGQYSNDWKCCINRAALYLGFLQEFEARGYQSAQHWLQIRKEAIECGQ